MSAIFKCKDGNEHDFDSNTESEYCAKGCGEKWAIYAIKKLGADLKEKDAAVEQLKADLEATNNVYKMNRLYVKNVREEITVLKSKLAKAKETLEFYASLADRLSVEYSYLDGTFAFNVVSDDRFATLAKKSLSEIGEG